MTERLAYTVKEAAEQVGLSEGSLNKAIASGALIARYVGTKVAYLAALPTLPVGAR
jgi:excisionase family DNA binding protein